MVCLSRKSHQPHVWDYGAWRRQLRVWDTVVLKCFPFRAAFCYTTSDSFQVILASTAFHKSTISRHPESTPLSGDRCRGIAHYSATKTCLRALNCPSSSKPRCLDFTLPGGTCKLASLFLVHSDLYDSFHFLARF